MVDYGFNTDEWVMTKEQLENVKAVKAQQRTRSKSPNGYHKIYPQSKMELFTNISNYLVSLGATVSPAEKCNYRDLDFTLNGIHYKIVLSNPRK